MLRCWHYSDLWRLRRPKHRLVLAWESAQCTAATIMASRRFAPTATMDIIHTPALHMVTTALIGSTAACLSAPDRGSTASAADIGAGAASTDAAGIMAVADSVADLRVADLRVVDSQDADLQRAAAVSREDQLAASVEEQFAAAEWLAAVAASTAAVDFTVEAGSMAAEATAADTGN